MVEEELNYFNFNKYFYHDKKQIQNNISIDIANSYEELANLEMLLEFEEEDDKRDAL